jgi:hypothetical protein
MDGKEKRRRTHRPRYSKIPFASEYSGRSKSRLYELAAEHPGLIRKDGASSLVDMDLLDEIMDAFPIAVIKPSTKSVAADSADDTDNKEPGATVKFETEATADDREPP